MLLKDDLEHLENEDPLLEHEHSEDKAKQPEGPSQAEKRRENPYHHRNPELEIYADFDLLANRPSLSPMHQLDDMDD